MADDPQELFGLRLGHVGINASDNDEAVAIAERFTDLLGLPGRETPISIFPNELVEVMREGGRGEKGHIGLHVDADKMADAEAWFAERGFPVEESSRRLMPDGTTRLVYFQEPIGGFAIHLTQE